MEPLTLLFLYLQGSNAGQKCLKISRIFKFDVPLWLTRIWSDLVTTSMVALSGRNRSWKVQPCIYKSFGDLAVWWTPFKIGHFATQLPDFTYISPKFVRLVWLNYACQWLPNYGVGRYGYVEQAQSMEPLTLLVLYLQGSNAGQKCLKISRIFKFDVPLWLTRIWSDLVTTKYGSPIR